MVDASAESNSVCCLYRPHKTNGDAVLVDLQHIRLIVHNTIAFNMCRVYKLQTRSEGFLGHYVVKVLSGDLSAVGGGSLQHFFQFLNVHCFSQFLGNSANVVGVYESRVVLVEKVEDLVDAVLNQI